MENQTSNYSSVVDTISNMFGNVITKEVIWTVVESFEGDLDLSVDAIMNITSDTKNESQTESEVDSSSQAMVPSTSMLSIPSSQTVSSGLPNPITAPSSSYSSKSQSKGAIPKLIPNPKLVSDKGDFWTDQIRQIIKYHNQGARILILLRGVPGSGKSFLAKQIVETTIGSEYHYFQKHIFSTDDFFMVRGQYLYEKYRLSEAHSWNQTRVRLELINGLSPVIVDNTNIEIWEMEPYLREGIKNGYYIEVVEPNTPWAKKANQLHRRNIHNVPLISIKRMLDNFHSRISGLQLKQAYGLAYPANMIPPVLRNDPPILKDVKDQSRTEEQNQTISQGATSTGTASPDIQSSVLQFHGSSTTEGLTEAVPDAKYLKNHEYVQGKNIIEGEPEIQSTPPIIEGLQTNTQENILDGPSNEEIKNQNIVLEVRKCLDEIEKVEAEWENGESWEDDSKKSDVACSESALTLHMEPKPPRKQDVAESVFSGNIMDSVHKCDDWSQISMYMPSWNDTPQPSTCNNKMNNEETCVAKTSSSTYIDSGDMDVMNNKHNYKIINATPRDINIFHVSSNIEKIPDKRKLDKSTMTNEHSISEPHNRCKNEERHFTAFRRMFKNVGRADLRDIFDKCRGDVNWAVDIVLDSMTNKLLDVIENEDLSDVEEEIFEQCECLAAYNIIPDGQASSTIQNTTSEDAQENTNDRPMVQRKPKKDTVLSETSMELKRQIEKNVNISENHYSPFCLKLKKMRHGENVKPETTPEQSDKSESPNMEEFAESSGGTTASVEDSDDEESNAESIEEPAKVVNVNVGREFINTLDAMFGRQDMIYPGTVEPKLTISVSILNELNASWMESLMYQLENESKQMQEMIKQDEEFARELALKEEELLNAGKEPAVPDFKEIMDMDFALSLYQKDLAEWRNSEPQDLAARLTRDKLYNLFPEVSQDVLAELLAAHHNNFQETVESLLVSTGKQDILEQENGVNKFVMEKEMKRQKQILEQEKKSMTWDDFPLLPKGETATMDIVNQYRHKAEMHLVRRNAHYQKAQEYIHRGMTQVADHYSTIAAYHKQRYEQANSMAAAALVQYHAQNNRDNATIDLHYMRVGEARESLDLFLDFHIRKLQDNQNRNPRQVSLFFITGRGLHSHGQPRIKPAVKKRLRERGLAFSERNPGLLTAKISANDKLSYQISPA